MGEGRAAGGHWGDGLGQGDFGRLEGKISSNRPLRAILTQRAHAAVRTKGTYLSALSQRLATRRGKKRAIIAVAHAIMVSVFPMLSRKEPYRELGANSCAERRRQCTVAQLTRRIEHLGYRVHLEPVAAPAA